VGDRQPSSLDVSHVKFSSHAEQRAWGAAVEAVYAEVSKPFKDQVGWRDQRPTINSEVYALWAEMNNFQIDAKSLLRCRNHDKPEGSIALKLWNEFARRRLTES
jgi:hypothetical protein